MLENFGFYAFKIVHMQLRIHILSEKKLLIRMYITNTKLII